MSENKSLDDLLCDWFQVVSEDVQRRIGVTCFGCARFCTCLVALYMVSMVAWVPRVFSWGTSVPRPGLVFIVVSSVLLIRKMSADIRAIEAETLRLLFVSGRNRERVKSQGTRLVLVFLFFLNALLGLLLLNPRPLLISVTLLGVTCGLYFASCTPFRSRLLTRQ